jgi:peptide/nickel transport system substrate-binding protein
MTREKGFYQTRRQFMATAAVGAGAAAMGLPRIARAQPQHGGKLRFSTRVDGAGLDPHRNLVYYVSNPTAATTQGLIDLNKDMELVPGVAEEWEMSDDMMTWTFRLRRGAEYHNGRDIDAESVKWNLERMMDPATSFAFTRASLEDIESIEVDGKHIVRIHLNSPSAVFAGNLVYYPVNLIAPDSVDQVDTHPIGCGPFKFVSWQRYAKTELVRFENYFETDQYGNQLPYLDAIDGFPTVEDRVRLTSLRTGEVDLIENMAYSDVHRFKETLSDRFNTWDVPHIGTGHLNINVKSGPFAMDAPDGKLLRQAVAHAIDREAIHHAVFNELGYKLNGYYSEASPWYMEGIQNVKEYDPEKSRSILRKLNAENMPIEVVARSAFQYMSNTAELVHSMLLDAGFRATNEVFDNPVLRQKYARNDWGIDSTATSYRFEPDGWYSRWILSSAAENQLRVGYKNEEVDKLIIEARKTPEQSKRLELYTEVESLVNDDAALIYTHAVPMTAAADKRLKGYEPTFAGVFTYSGGGIRTAHFDETA